MWQIHHCTREKFFDRFDIHNRQLTLEPRYNVAAGQTMPTVVQHSPNSVARGLDLERLKRNCPAREDGVAGRAYGSQETFSLIPVQDFLL